MSHDPVTRSDALDAQLARNPVITNLVVLAEQHGRIIKILITLMVVIALLSLGLGYATWKALTASRAAKTASSQSHVNCLAANQARSSQRQLWTFILSFPPPSQETAQARERRLTETKKFKAYVQKQFAPLDCTAPTVQTGAQDLPKATPLSSRTPSSAPSVEPLPSPTVTTARVANHTTSGSPQPSQSASSSRSPTRPTQSPTSSPSPSPSRGLCVPVVKKCIGLGVGMWSLWL